MSEEKKLRVVKKITVEEIIEVESQHEPIHLENINIAGQDYDLDIINIDGKLSLDFGGGDYIITISENGVRFDRTLYRPNHDHNDNESLQIKVDDSAEPKKGTVDWRKRFPYDGDNWEFKYIDFGSRIE